MGAPFSAFSDREFRTRFEEARNLLLQGDLDAFVIVAPEHLYYFGGYDSWVSVNSPQAMIFTSLDDEPTLILRDVDLSLATETSWLSDITTYNMVLEDYPARLKDVLQQKGLVGGKVGIEKQSYALTYSLGQALETALPSFEFVDSTSRLGALRLTKSPQELAYINKAATYAASGLKALQTQARTGINEMALGTEIDYALRKAGSDYPAIPTELTSGSRSAGCHGTPRNRMVESGDLIHAEFAGVEQRYHAVAFQTLACGEPSPEAKELYDAGLASLRAGIGAIKPGASVAAVEEASLEPLKALGLEQAAMMRFGYGIGIAYPPIWLETLQIARGFDQSLEPGMVFVLHSCLELPNENLGIIQGGTYHLTPNGLNMIVGTGDSELLIA
ncbi:Xaa-Pro peptidase family protein [Alphaproteobacteria bacterium]|nr:Xaa-Pro peptidase family protein [Alphaproteobacteria bacterium]